MGINLAQRIRRQMRRQVGDGVMPTALLAFRWKVTFFVIAGFNVLFFYARTFERLKGPDPDAPPRVSARVAGAVSLCAGLA